MKDDRTYLLHILEAIEKIRGYIETINFDDFSDNDMMIDKALNDKQ